jgi:hypothetical protein
MMFCKHDDKIYDKIVLPSAFEQLSADGDIIAWSIVALYRKKVVILLKCTKCKRVREIVEYNP